MRFQRLSARLALAALLLAAIGMGFAVAGVRGGLFAYALGLELMVPATALAIIALVCALAWMLTAFRRNEGDAKRTGLFSLAGSLLLLWLPLHTVYRSLSEPPVHDITTNPGDPPQFVKLARLRGPGMNSPVYDGARQVRFGGEANTVAYMTHTYFPKLTAPYAQLQNTQAKLFWHAFETAKKCGWRITDYNAQTGIIEGVHVSFWFGQVSDMVVLVRPAGTQGAMLDARVQSEVGDKDFGGNAALLKAYRAALAP